MCKLCSSSPFSACRPHYYDSRKRKEVGLWVSGGRRGVDALAFAATMCSVWIIIPIEDSGSVGATSVEEDRMMKVPRSTSM